MRQKQQLWMMLCAMMVQIAGAHTIRMKLDRIDRTAEEKVLEKVHTAAFLAGTTQANKTQIKRALETSMFLGAGVHTVNCIVGGQKRVLIIDTGSGDTAFPCETCTHCGHFHANPVYKFTKSSSYITCKDNDELGLQSCKACMNQECSYGQKYVEGSKWLAKKVKDDFSFKNEHQLKAQVVFGCIFEEHGAFEEQKADGIMGMSRDLDAVFIQFHREKVIDSRMFSQCISANGGSMAIGGVDTWLNDEEMVYTPLRDTNYKYWTVSMESLQVGGKKIDVPSSIYNANRGCVFDSGTTFIYLPSAIEDKFETLWAEHFSAGHTYSMYVAGGQYHLTDEEIKKLPTLCFNLQNNAKFYVPPEQYMRPLRPGSSKYIATVFFRDFAHATILGASALMNHNIIYDMDNHRIGFARSKCDSVDKPTSLAIDTSPGGDTFRPIYQFNVMNFCAGAMLAYVALFLWKLAIENDQDHQERKTECEEAGQQESLEVVYSLIDSEERPDNPRSMYSQVAARHHR